MYLAREKDMNLEGWGEMLWAECLRPPTVLMLKLLEKGLWEVIRS